MIVRRRALFSALFFLLAPSFAIADQTIVRRVTFKDGHATIRGQVKGYDTVDYIFPAGAGESIKIHFDGDKRYSNYFMLTAPGGTEPLHNATLSSDDFDGAANVAGDYTARVFLMRNDARRGRTARYKINIAVGETHATNEKGPDFADGLTGGPDYWQVTGVAAGDSLALRDAPSPKGKLVTQIANGATLKNLGCKNTRGQRWCRVETIGDSQRGWTNGKYLREGAAP